MTESQSPEDPKVQVEAASKAFEQEFERFARFTQGSAALQGLTLDAADAVLRDLVALRTRHLGKKSVLATSKKAIGRIAPEDRATFGQLVQAREASIVNAIDQTEEALKNHVEAARIERESIDVTLPGKRARRGHLHPITLLRERIEDIFVALGYAIEDDREIETDFYNFDALNIPENHPARASQDTFYTTEGLSLIHI